MDYEKPEMENSNLATIYLCYRLLNAGVNFDVEYKVSKQKSYDIIKRANPEGNIRRRACRFDIVIIKDNEIIAIVETKPIGRKRMLDKYESWQLKRYECFGVPVILCCGKQGVNAAFKEILEIWTTTHSKLCIATGIEYVSEDELKGENMLKRLKLITDKLAAIANQPKKQSPKKKKFTAGKKKPSKTPKRFTTGSVEWF